MEYRSRKLIRPEHLNSRGTLFGGELLKWIDEEAAIFAICQLGQKNIVTKAMSKIDFMSSPKDGDIIEIGCQLEEIGNTSISVRVDVRNKDSKIPIITIDKIVFVLLDENGKPTKHNMKDPLDI
jgi:acyl-CoA hydrolase